MTFEGQYLTYAEYQELGGSAIGEMPFNLLEYEARKQIDLRTQRRLVGQKEIPEEVKICTYHLINKIKSYAESTASASSSDGSVASESTDGYSISYNQVNATQIQDIVKSKNVELKDIILTYLCGVLVNGENLVFMGV